MITLISGAARGLGYALTEEGLSQGDTVIAGCRTLDSADVLKRLSVDYPSRLHIIEMDVENETSVQQGAQYITEQLGLVVDVVINNAAIFVGYEQSIRELDINRVAQSFNINTLGPIRVVKHFVPLMSTSTIKIILNISSEAGSITTCGKRGYGYAISKTALNMFNQIVGHDLSADGFTVFSIHPGRMRTDMGRPEFPDSAQEVAKDIYSLANRTAHQELAIRFINRHGSPMPL